jgi:hypothetical protein
LEEPTIFSAEELLLYLEDGGILIIFSEEYKVYNSPIYSFLNPSVTSSLLCAHILFSTLFSDIFTTQFSLKVTDKVSGSSKCNIKIKMIALVS